MSCTYAYAYACLLDEMQNQYVCGQVRDAIACNGILYQYAPYELPRLYCFKVQVYFKMCKLRFAAVLLMVNLSQLGYILGGAIVTVSSICS